ncbi:MAG TPA: efflux RND transporter periplasmic adaptor subunit [Granulicella sp.]|jgi:RND family efflux transporter MFP subunit|nr:efflux RND transporter periplasmic adaptor subunit [Granulicella sp.]
MTDHAQKTPVAPSNGGGIKWFLLIPVVLCAGGAVSLFLRAQQSRELNAGTKILAAEPVAVTHAQQGAPDSEINLPSTIQPYNDSPIFARTSGYVAHWYADIGTHVRQGQLLAVIESPEVDQELNQARATLDQNKANLTLAGITAKRYQDLSPTNAVPQQMVDQNNQNLSAMKASTEAAQANVNRLEQMQGFEKVVAPFDGVITQRLTDIGNLINAGNSGNGAQLFRIAKINVVRVFVPVPESYSDQISDHLKATLELTSLPGQQFAGTVTRSSHSITPGSHTLLTEIDIPNPTGKLLPGAYADVHIHLATQVPHLIVPTGAVLFQAAGPQVAVVDNKNQIQLHKVTLGRDFGNTMEVMSGITDADQIVSSPPDYLVNGMPVTVQPAVATN